MRLFLISAAVAALALASPAHAQNDNHGHGHRNDNRGDQHHPTSAPAKPENSMSQSVMDHRGTRTWRAPNGMIKTTASPGAVYNNSVRRDRRSENYWRNNDRRDRARHDNNWHGNGYYNNWHNRHYNDRYRNRGNVNAHINFNRRNVYARHHYRYRGRAWYWPRGYSYRRWSYGMTLPSLFWAQQYWISDYSDYGLAYPPPGTVWVRYGDDAILIDQYSGEILEVVYDQFD